MEVIKGEHWEMYSSFLRNAGLMHETLCEVWISRKLHDHHILYLGKDRSAAISLVTLKPYLKFLTCWRISGILNIYVLLHDSLFTG